MQKQYLVQKLVSVVCLARQQGLAVDKCIAILEGILAQLYREQSQQSH